MQPAVEYFNLSIKISSYIQDLAHVGHTFMVWFELNLLFNVLLVVYCDYFDCPSIFPLWWGQQTLVCHQIPKKIQKQMTLWSASSVLGEVQPHRAASMAVDHVMYHVFVNMPSSKFCTLISHPTSLHLQFHFASFQYVPSLTTQLNSFIIFAKESNLLLLFWLICLAGSQVGSGLIVNDKLSGWTSWTVLVCASRTIRRSLSSEGRPGHWPTQMIFLSLMTLFYLEHLITLKH